MHFISILICALVNESPMCASFDDLYYFTKPSNNETKSRLRERLYQIDSRVFQLKAELHDLENERIEIMMDLWLGNGPMQQSIERRARFDDGSFAQIPRRRTKSPTHNPTINPTSSPTNQPTTAPTNHPTKKPTHDPTKTPTEWPTNLPTLRPTKNPTKQPTMKPTKYPTQKPTHHPTIDEDVVLEAYKSKQANHTGSIMVDLYEIKHGDVVMEKKHFDALNTNLQKRKNYDLLITKSGLDLLNGTDTKMVSYHKDIDEMYDSLFNMYTSLTFMNMTIEGLEIMTKAVTAFQVYCLREHYELPDIPKGIRNIIVRALFAKNQVLANIFAFETFHIMFFHAHEIKIGYIQKQSPDTDVLNVQWEERIQDFTTIFDETSNAIKSEQRHLCVALMERMKQCMNEVTGMKQLFTIVQALNHWKESDFEMERKGVHRICIITPSQLHSMVRCAIRIGMPSATIAKHLAVWNGNKWKFRSTT